MRCEAQSQCVGLVEGRLISYQGVTSEIVQGIMSRALTLLEVLSPCLRHVHIVFPVSRDLRMTYVSRVCPKVRAMDNVGKWQRLMSE